MDIEILGIEYRKTLMLLSFKDFCISIKKNKKIEKIREMYKNTPNSIETTKSLFLKEFNKTFSDDEYIFLDKLVKANLSKKPYREVVSSDVKESLFVRQNGNCNICGKTIDLFSQKSHIDHIVPFCLVGDELEDNYQILCDDCNLKKNSQVDFYFRMLINLF